MPARSNKAWRSRVAGAVLSLALLGTGCRPAPPPDPKSERVDIEGSETSRRERPPVFGDDGALLESGHVVVGLPLPRGLQPKLAKDGRYTFAGPLPIKKVLAYFGPRLITGEVDRVGEGAVYRNAVPRDVRGGAVKIDVSILSVRGGVRVEIQEIRAEPVTPPDPEKIGEMLREHWRHLD